MSLYQELDFGIKKGIGSRILYFTLIDSTNNFLKANSAAFPQGTVVWAEEQTAGKGRMNHKWESPQGKGLYFSILLKPSLARNIPLISLMTSLSVKHGIEEYASQTGFQPPTIDIKWPNDLLINGLKIGGILIEGATYDENVNLIVGVGLNVTAAPNDFSPQLSDAASSLQQSCKGMWERKELLKIILQNFNLDYQAFDARKILNLYRCESKIWGKQCYVETPQGTFKGVCRDLSPRGELIIETANDEISIISGTLFIDWKT